MRTLVTHDTDFSNITWTWLCYQRAFSAIYRKFKSWLLLQICLYSHMPSLVWIVWNEILHIVQSVALGVCFSIVETVMKSWAHWITGSTLLLIIVYVNSMHLRSNTNIYQVNGYISFLEQIIGNSPEMIHLETTLNP